MIAAIAAHIFNAEAARGHRAAAGVRTMLIDPRWFTVAGLVADIVGAGIIGLGVFISKAEAVRIGSPRVGSDDFDKSLRLPGVQNLLTQSRKAKIGLAVMAAGFALQVFGSWPR